MLKLKPVVDQLGRIEEGVAMDASQTRELGVFQSGYGAEDARLLSVFKLGLKANNVE